MCQGWRWRISSPTRFLDNERMLDRLSFEGQLCCLQIGTASFRVGPKGDIVLGGHPVERQGERSNEH